MNGIGGRRHGGGCGQDGGEGETENWACHDSHFPRNNPV